MKRRVIERSSVWIRRTNERRAVVVREGALYVQFRYVDESLSQTMRRKSFLRAFDPEN